MYWPPGMRTMPLGVTYLELLLVVSLAGDEVVLSPVSSPQDVKVKSGVRSRVENMLDLMILAWLVSE